ncbi:YidH family protein [Glutamicibacter sp. X7]
MSSEEPRSRLTRRVFPHGQDPDPRFTLANERTFLSWIRTSLAFIGGGIAVEAFTAEIFPAATRTVLSLILLMIGFLLAAGACVRWFRVESAMRHRRSLPVPLIVPLVSLASALGAAGLILVIARVL